MPLQTNGNISISDIKNELGVQENSLGNLSESVGFTSPHAISEFYGYSNTPPPEEGGTKTYIISVFNEGGYNLKFSLKEIVENPNVQGEYRILAQVNGEDSSTLRTSERIEGLEELADGLRFNINLNPEYLSSLETTDQCTSPITYWWGRPMGGGVVTDHLTRSDIIHPYRLPFSYSYRINLNSLNTDAPFDVRNLMLWNTRYDKWQPRDVRILPAFDCGSLGSGYTSTVNDMMLRRVYINNNSIVGDSIRPVNSASAAVRTDWIDSWIARYFGITNPDNSTVESTASSGNTLVFAPYGSSNVVTRNIAEFTDIILPNGNTIKIAAVDYFV